MWGWRAADRALRGREGRMWGLRNEEKVFWLGGFAPGEKEWLGKEVWQDWDIFAWACC